MNRSLILIAMPISAFLMTAAPALSEVIRADLRIDGMA